MSGMEKKRRDVETERAKSVGRSVISRRGVAPPLLYSVLSVFVCARPRPATTRLARRERTGGRESTTLREGIVFVPKKRGKKRRKNTAVEHARAVRAAICTFDTIECAAIRLCYFARLYYGHASRRYR